MFLLYIEGFGIVILIDEDFREFLILLDLFLVKGVTVRESIVGFLFFWFVCWKVFCRLSFEMVLGRELDVVSGLCLLVIIIIGFDNLLIRLGWLDWDVVGCFIELLDNKFDFKLICILIGVFFWSFGILFLRFNEFGLVDGSLFFDDLNGFFVFIFSLFCMLVRIWVGFMLLVFDLDFCNSDDGIEDGFFLIKRLIFWGFIRIRFMVFWWVIFCILFLFICKIMLLIWSLLFVVVGCFGNIFLIFRKFKG